ncbi:MAG: PAS domain S-box protein, partial [Candidatus Kapaibacterium sp.]
MHNRIDNTNINILVCDDEPGITELIKLKSGRLGIDCNTVSGGVEAIDYLKNNQPDMMLLDYKLRDMNGIEVIKNLHSEGLRVPFMIMTGFGDEKLAVEMMKLGARDYIVKDTNFPKLIEVILARLAESIRTEKELKKTEQDLLESRENLSITLESIGDAVIVVDKEKNIVRLNKIAESLTGWNRNDAFGKPIEKVFNIYNSHTGQRSINPIDRVFAEGKIVGLANDTTLLARDGAEYFIADSASPIRRADGAVIGAVLVFRDISEKYNQEKIIRQNSDRLRKAQAISHTGNWEIDLEKKTMWASEEAFRIYGLDYESPFIPLQTAQLAVIPEDRPMMDKALEDLIFNKMPYDVVFRIRHFESGEIRILHSKAECLRSDSGAPLAVQGVVRDITEHEMQQRALAESESMYRALFEEALNPILVVDEEGNYIDVNPAAEEFLEMPKSEIIRHKVWDFAPPGKLHEVRHEHDPFYSKRTVETKYLIKGRLKTLLLNVVPALKGDKKILFGLGQEITLIKHQTAQINEQKEMLRVIVENNPSAVAMFDRDMRYIFVSRSWLHSYKIEDEDIIGRSHYEVLPHLPEERREIHRRVLGGEVLHGEEDTLTLADGTQEIVRWEVRPWYESSGEIGGIIIFSEFITEKKETSRRLETSREQLSLIISTVPALIFYLDINHEFKFANEQFARWVDLPTQEIIGRKIKDALPQQMYDAIKSVLRPAAEGHPEELIYTHSQSRIPDKTFLIKIVPHFDKNNIYTGLLIHMHDITEQKAAADELERLNDELEQMVIERTSQLEETMEELKFENYERKRTTDELLKTQDELRETLEKEKELNELKSRFISTVSHEYRTPLTVIMSSAFLLEEIYKKGDSKKFERYLNKVKDSVRTMTRLLEDILIIGKSDAGKLDSRPDTFDLAQSLCEIAEETDMIDNKRHKISIGV